MTNGSQSLRDILVDEAAHLEAALALLQRHAAALSRDSGIAAAPPASGAVGQALYISVYLEYTRGES